MEKNEIAVSIRKLSKIYQLYDSPWQRFQSLLLGKKTEKNFVALHDINVDICRGESFAIVGKNGSGKSTLLQILAGILRQTDGEAQITGRVAALLELGSGFNPESTGYENIYMNAAILGLKESEIREKIQEIIEFADIGEHLHEPVKTYSSGMYVRLGFAVAVNVGADILLVDEALAVGDVFFRQKCYSKLNELKALGTTIVLVTHNMNEVEQFCDRAMLLQDGRQMAIDRSQDIVKQYYMESQESGSITENIRRTEKVTQAEEVEFTSGWKMKEKVFYDLAMSKEVSNGKATFLRIGLFDREGKARRAFVQGEDGYFYFEIEVMQDIQVPLAGVVLYDQRNAIIHGKDTNQTYLKLPDCVRAGEKIILLQRIRLDVAEGEYSFEAGFCHIPLKYYQKRDVLTQEVLNEAMERICLRNSAGLFAVTQRTVGKPTRMGFYGMCDLQGDMEIVMKNSESG